MSKFSIDDIKFYVWALSQPWPSMPNGYDGENRHKGLVRLAGDIKDTSQASLATINGEIENELRLDTDHQRQYWLQVDRAAEAIGMLESDGFGIDNEGRIDQKNLIANHGKYSDEQVFISLVKQNLDVYLQQLNQSNIGFEMVPTDPEQDASAVAGVNDYKTNILNYNNFDQQRKMAIYDGAAFGSGVLECKYDAQMTNPDMMLLEENLDNEVPISYEDFKRMSKLTQAHHVEYVDTFDIVTSRHANGQDSWDLSNRQHPYIHRFDNMRIADARQQYPEHAHEIQPASSTVYGDVNPRIGSLTHDNKDIITKKITEIKFPVNYDYQVPVTFSNGTTRNMASKNNRYAVCQVTRLEGVGVVDMNLDHYIHNRPSYVQWVNYPSSKHARGIGNCKFGYAPQKIHTIMFNGKLHYFNRMIKGGGFFLQGALDEDDIEERIKDNAYVGIDVNNLPPELQGRPIGDLIYDNRPSGFPSAYGELEQQAERYVNVAMNVAPPRRGFQSGNSGRQEMALINQSKNSMAPTVKSLKAAMLSLGRILHSNIVQFDGKRYNIEFFVNNEIKPKEYRKVVLNKVVNESLNYNLYAGNTSELTNFSLEPTLIKNSIESLRYSTKISGETIIPDDPTERRIFYQNLLQKIQPLIETKRGITTLKWIDRLGFGGIPHFNKYIKELQESIDKDRQFQQELAQKNQQQAAQQQQFENRMELADKQLNQKRLEDKADDDTVENQNDAMKILFDFVQQVRGQQDDPNTKADDISDQTLDQVLEKAMDVVKPDGNQKILDNNHQQ